jgi:hypothetical protein
MVPFTEPDKQPVSLMGAATATTAWYRSLLSAFLVHEMNKDPVMRMRAVKKSIFFILVSIK